MELLLTWSGGTHDVLGWHMGDPHIIRLGRSTVDVERRY